MEKKRRIRKRVVQGIMGMLLSVLLTGCSIPFPTESFDPGDIPGILSGKGEETEAATGSDSEGEPDDPFGDLDFERKVSGEDVAGDLSEDTETDPDMLPLDSAEKEGNRLSDTPGGGSFYYDRLSQSKQKVYEEVYEAIVSFSEDAELSTLDTDELNVVYQSVMGDHPEIYYCVGYTYRLRTVNDQPDLLRFSAKYSYTSEDKEVYDKQIAAAAERILSGILPGAGEYEIVKYFYETIILNTEYDTGARDDQNLLSVLLWNRSVCSGYAKAFEYLCHLKGIECAFVSGIGRGESHGWNLVKVNGAYYYVDATWGDPMTVYSVPEDAGGNEPQIGYGYLLITKEELLRNHVINNVMDLPDCSATQDNYFNREGYLLTAFDPQAIREMFQRARDQGLSYVQIKAGSREVFDQLGAHLFDEEHLQDYYDGREGNYSYITDELLYIYTIEL